MLLTILRAQDELMSECERGGAKRRRESYLNEKGPPGLSSFCHPWLDPPKNQSEFTALAVTLDCFTFLRLIIDNISSQVMTGSRQCNVFCWL